MKTDGVVLFHDAAQEAPGGLARENFKVGAGTIAARVQRVAVGTPDAQDRSGAIEFENEFMKFAEERCEEAPSVRGYRENARIVVGRKARGRKAS